MTVIEKYPHPELLQRKSMKIVAEEIQKKTCYQQAISEKMADKAIAYSKTE